MFLVKKQETFKNRLDTGQSTEKRDCLAKTGPWGNFRLTSNQLTSMVMVRNSAPKDSTCSLTIERVSKALTMAPMHLAWPIAARPATPPPITSTLAGGTLPAAVIWPKQTSKGEPETERVDLNYLTKTEENDWQLLPPLDSQLRWPWS